MVKTIITSGCSFTQTHLPSMNITVSNWPLHLSTRHDLELVNYGYMGSGNAMIARTILHGVTKYLNQASDILVGIMWSGRNRHSVYKEDVITPASPFPCGPRRFIDNPIDVEHPNSKVKKPGGWLDLNAITSDDNPWKNTNNIWYNYFYDNTYSTILTLENILWVQSFLELHNINYFMSVYTNDVLDYDVNDSNIKWMHDSVKWDKFIKIPMYEWCKDQSKEFIKFKDEHPSDIGSNEYVKNIIEPHLQSRGLI